MQVQSAADPPKKLLLGCQRSRHGRTATTTDLLLLKDAGDKPVEVVDMLT